MIGIWQRASPEKRIVGIGVLAFFLDQLTKFVVVATLPLNERHNVFDGFFSFVHWGNTGSAMSMFHDNNAALAVVAVAALAALWWGRRHFESDRAPGQIALGLLFGGIAGNLADRLIPQRHHVVDFLYFYLQPRGSGSAEAYFPAFNVADIAICTGVGLLLLFTWNTAPAPSEKPSE
ncbi:MAG: signal peptidase II [Verrucomicrobia bacterium]|nr:MAG: signal peptidase II [Verrucomicrobiota bacterium]